MYSCCQITLLIQPSPPEPSHGSLAVSFHLLASQCLSIPHQGRSTRFSAFPFCRLSDSDHLCSVPHLFHSRLRFSVQFRFPSLRVHSVSVPCVSLRVFAVPHQFLSDPRPPIRASQLRFASIVTVLRRLASLPCFSIAIHLLLHATSLCPCRCSSTARIPGASCSPSTPRHGEGASGRGIGPGR